MCGHILNTKKNKARKDIKILQDKQYLHYGTTVKTYPLSYRYAKNADI